MIDDFVPIIHDLPGRTMKVYPVADVHLGSRESDVSGFEKFLKKVESEEDSYIVLVGDIVNNATRNSLSNCYDDIMTPSQEIDRAVELLSPVKDKILGAVGGNHESRSRKAVDLDPMYAIMLLLNKGELYRTNFAMIRLRLRDGNAHCEYGMMLIHGKSDSKRRQFQYSIEGVDALVTAHVHSGVVEKPARLVLTRSNNVVVRPLVSIVATSWLGWGGYAAAGLYKPTTTSDPQCLQFSFVRTNKREGKVSVIW